MTLLSNYRHPGISLVASVFLAIACVNARAGGTVGTTGFGGARIGAGFGGISASSSVIRHGGTGFSIYSQQGVTRVIGTPQVSRNILLPDGQRVRIVGDGKGGAHVFGPRGSQRILGNPRLFAGDGP